MPTIAGRNLSTPQAGVLAAGIVLFVFSFLHWFGIHLCSRFGSSKTCVSAGANAWNTGFLSWAAVVLGIAAAAWLAARLFGGAGTVPLSVGPNTITLGLAGLGLISCLLKFLVGYHSTTRELGIYVGFLALIVETVFAFLLAVQAGEQIPGLNRRGGSRTQ